MKIVNLKDAFFTMPIHPDYQKFLKFKWEKHCYAFREIANGYSEAMRVFTKLLKLPLSILRKHGYLSIVFADDSYFQGENNITATVDLLQIFGFKIHPEKSVLVPTQEILIPWFCFKFCGNEN